MEKYKLSWQEPVITELEFSRQNLQQLNYISFPWATIIDLKFNNPKLNISSLLDEIKKIIISYKIPKSKYFTCCQHIKYYELLDFFSSIGLKTLYISHKSFFIDTYNNIKLIAIPLYAVNIESPERNIIYLNNKDSLLEKNREYLLSFQGTYTDKYISNIRKQIVDFNWPDNCFVKKTQQWHFQNEVYKLNKGKLCDDDQLNEDKISYNELLLTSRFSLCPSGTGPNSIRFWESLAFGSIPILIADTLELPEHDFWKVSILRIKEKDLEFLLDILEKIPEELETQMRKNCLFMYEYFKHNYGNFKY